MLDVVVVGGGPAGLVTSLHARRRGLDVAVVESRPVPIDKACGEGLMPPAVRALQSLDVAVPGRPFVGIRYTDGRKVAEADFAQDCGYGARRTELHARLHAAAERADVKFVDARVTDVEQDEDGVSVAGLRGAYLVAADGLHSQVRRSLGLARPARGRRYGIRAHYACAPWTDRVEVHWAPDSEAYVTPVGADCVGVAVLGTGQASYAERLKDFPGLLERLPADPVERPRAAGPLRQNVRSRVAGRVLLVGDAAGYVDALTGEGLAIAFACAEALVDRVAAGTPAAYEGDYRRLTRRYRVLTSALLEASARPMVRRQIVPLSARAPWLFQAIVRQLAH